MKFKLRSLINPRRILDARKFSREQQQYDRSQYDLELYLYANILSNDMLHYGYFDDPEIDPKEISIADFERAQEQYAEQLLKWVDPQIHHRVLDAGCGMGGLTHQLLKRGFEVTALTPNDHQFAHIRQAYPDARAWHERYEACPTADRFDAIIHSESLQYIPLDDAFEKSHSLLNKSGLWIISDYFNRVDDPEHTSGHSMTEFDNLTQSSHWKKLAELDITGHTLPTLRFVRFYADRFLFPLKHFGEEKLRFKAPFWYSLSQEIRDGIQQKIDREMASVDPELFLSEKIYKIIVLEKTDT